MSAAPAIAVFRARPLGAMLCAIPALRALKRALPKSRVTLIGPPFARDFARRVRHIDDVVPFPGFPGLEAGAATVAALPAFLSTVQARRFDLVLQMHDDGHLANPLVATFGAQHLAGFVGRGAWNPAPTSFLPWPAHLPEIRRLLALLEFLGIPPCGEELEWPILAEEHAVLARLLGLAPGRRLGYACLHPGGGLAWPADRFAALADRLAQAGLRVVFTGSRSEASRIAAVRARMRAGSIDVAGTTSLATLAALLSQARVVVAADPGIARLTGAVGTPAILLGCGDASLGRRCHAVGCGACAGGWRPSAPQCAAGIATTVVIQRALHLLQPESETHHAPQHATV